MCEVIGKRSDFIARQRQLRDHACERREVGAAGSETVEDSPEVRLHEHASDRRPRSSVGQGILQHAPECLDERLA